jgi:SAM-dependent methyltransferase
MQFTINLAQSTPLCEIMGRNNSDKGHMLITRSWHNYTPYYYKMFESIKDSPLRIFELGLGTNNENIPSSMGSHGRPGASLYGWREFFVNSQIFGADIDRDILFDCYRIKTYYCDQTNPDVIKNMWDEPELKENFDIIIEDGLHTFDANVCFFENSIHKLKPNGIYIIEDIETDKLELWSGQIKEWSKKYDKLVFKLVEFPSHLNSHDNNLLIAVS